MRERYDMKTSAGFTLLELMLTITVAAVIMGLAIPNMRQFMWNNRITAAANDMVVAITAARSEAIKNRVQSVICLSSNPTAATPTCDGNGTQGWVVFVDTDGDRAFDAGEQITLRHSALPGTLSVRVNPANARLVAFAPSGFKTTASPPPQLTSLVVCDHRGNVPLYDSTQSTARAIVVETTGRARVSRLISVISDESGCP
jgi:type IV fimbrial biogenesis protein FimT